MKRALLLATLLGVFLSACGDDSLGSSGSSGGSGGTGGATTTTTTSAGGTTGGGGATGGTTGGTGGTTTTTAPVTADDLLKQLRSDLQGTLLAVSNEGGWPAHVVEGYLFVNTDPSLDHFAGDHDSWAGTPLIQDQGFSYVVLDVAAGDHYKFTNFTDWVADPWARSYTYDNNGEMSLVEPSFVHLDRYFQVKDATLGPRTVRVWVPEGTATHVLYTHDGQNLFDPSAFFGGWKIQDSVPPAMMVVGIDNTPARMDEYTHVKDVIDAGGPIGGLGDAYADLLQNTVRPLIKKHYGTEPAKVGTMGSSLGGLISFHIADKLPGQFVFAASLSGTMGWGSIGATTHNETMIERYQKHGHQGTALYLDSGGDGGACGDTDNDGIEDDIDEGDNYCENAQMLNVLKGLGYAEGSDLVYVWSPGAQHNEAEWASRVSVPMQFFAGL
ncbi:MAG: alpha/beta hydrolase-fold protein [Polyangiaceae bacterium]